MRRLFSAPVIIPLVFIGAAVLGILIYYWTVFSGRIDNLLQGEVFTRSAGIYAAPKQLREKESITVDELTGYLKRAGYVEKNQQADTNRGRYVVNGTSVRLRTATHLFSPVQFNVRAQISVNGGPFKNFGNPWWKRVDPPAP